MRLCVANRLKKTCDNAMRKPSNVRSYAKSKSARNAKSFRKSSK